MPKRRLAQGTHMGQHIRPASAANTPLPTALSKPASSSRITPAAYALGVGGATAVGPLADDLRAEHWSRTFTYAWRPSLAAFPVGCRGVVFAADFDVLVYIPRAAATHP